MMPNRQPSCAMPMLTQAWQRNRTIHPQRRSDCEKCGLDAYLWLAYRLHVLKADKLVTWAALKAQFGTGFSKLYHFKSKFPGTLALATAVYPAARINVTEEGVVLKPSPPPVLPRLIAIRAS